MRSPSEAGASVRNYLQSCVRIDTRSLAVFRMLLAVLVLADVCLRARNFAWFYTDQGVVPQSLARDGLSAEAPSLFFLATDPTVTAVLFVLLGLLGVQLLVGYRTRIATALSLVLVLSLDFRNPLVLSYADTLFAWLLFWAIFLPLGERWSIDAVHADRQPRPAVANVASALALCQMITMYVVNGYHKTESELWTSGEAAVLVFGLDDMTFLLADLFHAVPTLLQYGGLAWFYMLLCSWVLVLARGRVRTLLVSMFAASHLSFAVTVRIGAFAFVAIAGLLLFLQASFWDDCRALARRVQNRIPAPTARMWSRLPEPDPEAVAARFPRVRLDWGPIRRLTRNPQQTVLTAAVGIFTIVALVSLLSAGGVVSDDVDPAAAVERGATGFVDHQTEWSIFAPEPRTAARYYVFPAQTESGERVDVYNDRNLTFDRPYDDLHHQYETYRERFYMNSISSTDPPEAPELLAEQICTEWAAEHDDELAHVTMYQVQEPVTVETLGSPAERDRSAVRFYEHGCGSNEPIEIVDPDENEDEDELPF